MSDGISDERKEMAMPDHLRALVGDPAYVEEDDVWRILRATAGTSIQSTDAARYARVRYEIETIVRGKLNKSGCAGMTRGVESGTNTSPNTRPDDLSQTVRDVLFFAENTGDWQDANADGSGSVWVLTSRESNEWEALRNRLRDVLRQAEGEPPKEANG